MKLKKISYVVALLGAGSTFIVPAALAAPVTGGTGWYVGGSVGQAEYRNVPHGLPNIDNKDTGYKIYGGYQIDPNWGVEATYFDLGKATANVPGFNARGSAGVTAWGLASVFTAPISNGFSVFGKLGLARSELKLSAYGVGIEEQVKESRTDVNFGFGAKYDFSKNFTVRAEWERLNNVGNTATIGETDIDFLSAGITYKF